MPPAQLTGECFCIGTPLTPHARSSPAACATTTPASNNANAACSQPSSGSPPTAPADSPPSPDGADLPARQAADTRRPSRPSQENPLAAALGEAFTPKRAVSYISVSTREQAQRGGAEEGFSLPAQREANRRKAQSMGALIVKEFADRGESARSANRPELQKMLAYLTQDGQIDYVIVHKLDRLARNRADDVEITRAFDEAGVRLVSTSENIDQTPGGMLLHGIMSSIAEFYSRNLAAEVIKGMGEKARAGGTIGRAPLGYLNRQGRDSQGRQARWVDVDPVRGPLITQAFTEYATDRWTLSTLTDHLTAHGLTTAPTPSRPSHPLDHNTLLNILRNPYYRGIVTYQGVHYPGTHQPLIDEATWQRVQTVLSQHRHGERQRIHNHHLKTTVRCGQCGGRLIIHHAKARNGHIYPYFVCSYRQRHRDQCSFKAVLIDDVDHAVADLYRHIHITPDERRTIEKHLRIELDRLYARQHTHTQKLTVHARTLKAQQATLLQAHYADAVPLDLFKAEQTRLARELDHTSRELAALTADREHLQHRLEEALALLEHCHRLYTHPNTPPSLKKLLNTVFFTDILINPTDNTPTTPAGTPRRPIHPHPRPPFDHLTTPQLRHDIGLTNPEKNRDSSDSDRQNDTNHHNNDDSRNRHSNQDAYSQDTHGHSGRTIQNDSSNNGPDTHSRSAHRQHNKSQDNRGQDAAPSQENQDQTTRSHNTHNQDNTKTLQENLPEGNTQIKFGDVSCKSTMVELRGFEPLTFSLRTRRATNCAIAPKTPVA